MNKQLNNPLKVYINKQSIEHVSNEPFRSLYRWSSNWWM